MNQQRKVIVWLAVFATALAAAYFAYTGLSARYGPENAIPSVPAASSQAPSSQAGSVREDSAGASSAAVAPDFTVYDGSGKKVRLSDFKGRPVVLNFWASWCYWCKQEMPEFNKVYADEKKNVQFLFVDWTDGRQETQEKGEAFLKDNGFSFPAYYDLDQSAVSAYGLSGIPATFFIRADGTVAGGSEGAISGDALRQGIKAITAAK